MAAAIRSAVFSGLVCTVRSPHAQQRRNQIAPSCHWPVSLAAKRDVLAMVRDATGLPAGCSSARGRRSGSGDGGGLVGRGDRSFRCGRWPVLLADDGRDVVVGGCRGDDTRWCTPNAGLLLFVMTYQYQGSCVGRAADHPGWPESSRRTPPRHRQSTDRWLCGITGQERLKVLAADQPPAPSFH